MIQSTNILIFNLFFIMFKYLNYILDGIIFSIPIFEKGAATIFCSLTDRFGPRMDKGNNLTATEIAKKTNGKVKY